MAVFGAGSSDAQREGVVSAFVDTVCYSVGAFQGIDTIAVEASLDAPREAGYLPILGINPRVRN